MLNKPRSQTEVMSKIIYDLEELRMETIHPHLLKIMTYKINEIIKSCHMSEVNQHHHQWVLIN